MEEADKNLDKIINEFNFKQCSNQSMDIVYNISERIIQEKKNIKFYAEQFWKYQNILLNDQLDIDKKYYIQAFA